MTSAIIQDVASSSLDFALKRLDEGHVKSKTKLKAAGDLNELNVEARRSKRLRLYDRFLKSFKYSAALDAVLRKVRPFKPE